MKQRLINSIILTFLILLYSILHADVEGYICNKVEGVNDVVYHALSENAWYGWMLVGLEVAGVGYYLWRYRHDVAFRFWHFWAYVILFVVFVLTDEGWIVISPIDSWYSFANISKAIAIVGCIGTIATYFINRKDKEKTVYHSLIDKIRKDYAKTIVECLTEVNNINGSYAIGICGGWGSGKTTFLGEIKELLKNEKCDVYEFNAWDCSSEQNIASDFFSMLRAAVRPYCSSLEKSIFDYEAALSDAGVPSTLQKIVSSIFGGNESSIYELKKQIKDALQKAQHNIYIIIDDLDRMEAGEILEVLKLIRNNANFPYLKFIVAYDKDYVTSQIVEITKKDGYLNKIFMAEYFLPKLSDSNSKFDLIHSTLSYIGDENKTRLFGMIDYKDRQIVETALGSLRKAEIFARQFDINYKFMTSGKGSANYHIADSFWLELLKMTDARIYDLMDNEPDKILVAQRSKSGALYYVLREEEVLKDLQIAPSTMEIIKMLLFDGSKSQSIKRMMYLENYPNYFAMGLTSGKLHRSEFIKLLNGNGDNDTVVKTVHEWINNGQYTSLLNHILMFPFDKLDKDQAKKMVMCAIAYCFRVSGNKYYIYELVDRCFRIDSYMEDVREELQLYATKVMESYVGKKDIWLSVSAMMVRVITNIKKEKKTMLWNEDFCTEILKRNFLSYLESEKPDASEIFEDSKMLNKIVKSSCRNYTIHARDEFDEDEHYHVQYIKEELLSWFREHKSSKKECIQKLETKYENVMDTNEYFHKNFDEEGYDYEIRSIFGSYEVFNKFKDECFENE